MGRHRSTAHKRWIRRTATTTDGRELRGVFNPLEPYPQCFAARLAGQHIIDDLLSSISARSASPTPSGTGRTGTDRGQRDP